MVSPGLEVLDSQSPEGVVTKGTYHINITVIGCRMYWPTEIYLIFFRVEIRFFFILFIMW